MEEQIIHSGAGGGRQKIGLSDIGLYIPEQTIALDYLSEQRGLDNPKLTRHFDRARRVTGQENIRFPQIWEDAATMAAEAAKTLLEKDRSDLVHRLRYLVAGTETGVDHSKPVSAYVQGMLQEAGIPVPYTMASFQVQHACAGGTMALLGVGGMLSMSTRPDEAGLILSSDIARYEPGTTAEITQGAGAAALLVEKDPQLLEIDVSSPGYCSRNVDDFFRPLGSQIAKVKGRYSMDCYIDNLRDAVNDYCERRGTAPAAFLEETDFFVLHTPFKTMPEKAMQVLLQENLGLINGQSEAFLASRGFYSGVEPVAKIGNTYSASLYIALAHLLREQYGHLGEDIVRKRIMLASYGSGNTMIVLSARVAEGAPGVISQWDLTPHTVSAGAASMEEYEAWVHGPYYGEEYNQVIENLEIPARSFYLSNIREDGYREYNYKPAGDSGVEESETSDSLYQPAEICC
jgi:hydroxymethylglutaryl-CoA synthase